MTSLKEALTWNGPAVVLLFTLGRRESSLDEGQFDILGMRPDEVDLFPVSTESWDRQAVVQAYDLTFEEERLDDPELPGYLRECLRKASAHAEGIAWLTFEGAFHFDHLFTDDLADQVYGYCVAGDEPVVVWDRELMKSDRWKREIGDVRSVLDRDFPA
ncbi:hypothetical protein [Streptomyces sp. Root369]|uniref:hypothetical protein n=1 Tax=Streptomyces sp. Root369 TaxID=1736523 RepID=UPI00070A83E5|nr:hypothetical protein [Streptomyces sp. Root369]KQW16149.1 hypothetical protein ASD08_24175 [Streptomyces sp. Root369]